MSRKMTSTNKGSLISDLLQRVAAEWHQSGVSIWHSQNGQLSSCGEWGKVVHNGEFMNKLQTGFNKELTMLTGAGYHLFFVNEEWAVAFFGEQQVEVEACITGLAQIQHWLPLLKKVAQLERQEQSFQSFTQVTKNIVSVLHSDQVLDFILESAKETTSVADTGFLFLYDQQLQKLRIRSAIGFRKESYQLTRLAPGEGISGQVFLKREPIVLAGMDNIKEAMSNMSAQNLKYYLDSTISSPYPFSVISVPLIVQHQCIGVLTLDNFTKDAPFSADDLQLLQTYADLSAVVIEHSRLFKQVQRQNEELLMMHQALSKEHESLQKTLYFHNELTNLAAKGFEMEEILATLYRTASVPIAVYDRLLVPISSYPADCKVNLPDNFLNHPAMKLVQQTRKWQRVDLQENGEPQTIMVTPVIGADRLLGYLCAWISPQTFMEIGKFIFEYSATMLALEWIKREAIEESQEQMKGQFVEEILAGEINTQLAEQARYLGLMPNDYYTVLLIQEEREEQEKHLSWKTFLTEWLEYEGLHGLSVQRGKILVLILGFPESLTLKQRTDLLHKLIRELKQKQGIKVGIGRIHQGLSKIEKAFKDAQQCMELFRLHHPQQSLLYYGDLGVIRFFLQQDKEELQSFLEEYLGPLLEFEQGKERVLLTTLLAYVQYERDIKKVTSELNIHVNTLYYRIQRLEQILGYSVAQKEEWLNISLACQIYRFLEEWRGA